MYTMRLQKNTKGHKKKQHTKLHNNKQNWKQTHMHRQPHLVSYVCTVPCKSSNDFNSIQ